MLRASATSDTRVGEPHQGGHLEGLVVSKHDVLRIADLTSFIGNAHAHHDAHLKNCDGRRGGCRNDLHL
jgi:hypothetical protein